MYRRELNSLFYRDYAKYSNIVHILIIIVNSKTKFSLIHLNIMRIVCVKHFIFIQKGSTN